MANIEQDLQAIMEARYGKDVRQSIHDAIYDINEVNEANISTVQGIADTAQGYANTALQAKTDAQTAQTGAETAQTGAETAQTGAETAQTNASDSAEDAEAWAVGKRNGTDVPSTDPTYENNSKYWQERANYWYEQAKSIAESFSGALRPMGTVTFANLPPVSQAAAGDMYNVSDEFTTTSDFVEGAGHVVPLGSNIYLTTNSKWDILAGSPVTGVKGSSENSYRRGNVNITKANIGLGNVDNTSDADKPISTAQQAKFDEVDADLNNKMPKSGLDSDYYHTPTSTWTIAANDEQTIDQFAINAGDSGNYLVNFIAEWQADCKYILRINSNIVSVVSSGSLAEVLHLTGGDVLDIRVQNNGSSTYTVSNDSTKFRMEAFKLTN